jgi:hypothetical protein
MANITQTDLEAAIIDQTAAGFFPGKAYAFVAVPVNAGWQLAVAVANDRGYCPMKGKTFDKQDTAHQWADGLNEHIGLSTRQALRIVCSTMGGKRYSHVVESR